MSTYWAFILASFTHGLQTSNDGDAAAVMGANVFRHAEACVSLHYHPNGTHLISVEAGGAIRIWDLKQATLESTIVAMPWVSVSADGKKLAYFTLDDRFVFAEFPSRKLISSWPVSFTNYDAVALSPNWEQLALSKGSKITLVSLLTKKEDVLETKAEKAFCLAFSPNGKRLAFGGQGFVSWVDLETKAMKVLVEKGEGEILQLVFTSDSKVLFAGGEDEVIRKWNLTFNRKWERQIPGRGAVTSMLIGSKPQELLFCASMTQPMVWDHDDDELRPFSADVGLFEAASCAKSADGKELAFSTGASLLFVTRSGTILRDQPGHLRSVLTIGGLEAKQLILSGGRDGYLIWWDTASGKMLQKLNGHAGGVYALAFLGGDAQVATGGRDGRIRIWNVKTKKLERELSGHSACITGLAFMPGSNKLVSGSRDGEIVVWSLDEWKSMGTTKTKKALGEILPLEKGVLANLGDSGLMSFALEPEKRTSVLKGSWESMAVSADKKAVAALAPGRVMVTSLAGEKQTRYPITAPSCLTFLSNNDNLAMASFDGDVQIVNLTKYRSTWKRSQLPCDIAFSMAYFPQSSTLYLGGRNGVICRMAIKGQQ